MQISIQSCISNKIGIKKMCSKLVCYHVVVRCQDKTGEGAREETVGKHGRVLVLSLYPLTLNAFYLHYVHVIANLRN